MISLNRNGGIEFPTVFKKTIEFTVAVLTVGLFIVLVKLGFWQLSRGEEKQQLEQALIDREQQSPLTLQELVGMDTQNPLTGFRLKTVIKPQTLPLFYLDNITYEGAVGYRVLQPVEVSLLGQKQLMLVELGFVKALSTRDQLPNVLPIMTMQSLTGRVYQRSENPLSSDIMQEPLANGTRIQNLNMDQISELVDQPVMAFVLQPSKLPNHSLPMPWSPYPMSSQKHFGYAFQWFTMATVYALLVVLFIVRRRKTTLMSKD
jgi:cytochrome oxidase assembly protein ShyY1